MKWILASLFLATVSLNAAFSQKLTKYFVQFDHKANTPFSIENPAAYLSPRALERRQRQGIGIHPSDLPVDPAYLKALEAAGGEVLTVTKWLNGATVFADSATASRINSLPFVRSVEATGREYKKTPQPTKSRTAQGTPNYPRRPNYYGYAANQIEMLNGDWVHQLGYRGRGVLVAVLDGGFINVDVMPLFDSLHVSGRLLPSYDLVDGDRYPFESSTHGSQVLSTMAANIPFYFVGTAPDATYVCIKTEDTRSEMRIEEDNWVAGAELADSLGVDVINSSLGYTTFDIKSMNHQYSDMNGSTSRASRAASLAAAKGMIVVNSAGNEGGSSWRYIGSPADADSILAVGAVERNQRRAYFSSTGPTSDGRVKPDVMARGQETIVGSPYSPWVDSANGTSFASPVIAGMVSSFWQAFPDKTNIQVLDAIRKSGSTADAPDGKLGYGIPDFYKAFLLLADLPKATVNFADDRTTISYAYTGKDFVLEIENYIEGKEWSVVAFDLLGRQVYAHRAANTGSIMVGGTQSWSAGWYVVAATYQDKTKNLLLLKD